MYQKGVSASVSSYSASGEDWVRVWAVEKQETLIFPSFHLQSESWKGGVSLVFFCLPSAKLERVEEELG